MRRADDSIKLIASGSSNFSPGADWIGWNRTVLDYLKNDIDYISLHTYIGNYANNLEQFLAAGSDIDRRIAIVDGLIKAAREGQTEHRPIYIAFDEWNVWYRTFGRTEFETGRKGLEERYNVVRFREACVRSPVRWESAVGVAFRARGFVKTHPYRIPEGPLSDRTTDEALSRVS